MLVKGLSFYHNFPGASSLYPSTVFDNQQLQHPSFCTPKSLIFFSSCFYHLIYTLENLTDNRPTTFISCISRNNFQKVGGGGKKNLIGCKWYLCYSYISSLELTIKGQTSKLITTGCSKNAAALTAKFSFSHINWLQPAAEYGCCSHEI